MFVCSYFSFVLYIIVIVAKDARPVQEHNHPHILLLQIGNTFCKLPGGRLKSANFAAASAGIQPDWQVQEHNHPHILLLQIGNTFCKLPGGRLKPGENEIGGLKRKLSSKLAAASPGIQPDWQEKIAFHCIR
ncbi:hypothetical protein ACET3Z_009600 [Daucus carota]